MDKQDVAALLRLAALLRQVNDGEERAFESLVPRVYSELRRMAASLMRARMRGSRLQPTALVHGPAGRSPSLRLSPVT